MKSDSLTQFEYCVCVCVCTEALVTDRTFTTEPSWCPDNILQLKKNTFSSLRKHCFQQPIRTWDQNLRSEPLAVCPGAGGTRLQETGRNDHKYVGNGCCCCKGQHINLWSCCCDRLLQLHLSVSEPSEPPELPEQVPSLWVKSYCLI